MTERYITRLTKYGRRISETGETYDAALGTVGIVVGSDTAPRPILTNDDPTVVRKNNFHTTVN